MFVVPLSGDVVTVEGGVKYTVLSYAAYRDQPAVYVESADESTSTKNIVFDSIKSINGTPTKLTSGKVFGVASLVKRKIQLPQKNDKVIVDGKTLKVVDLKLRQQGKLTDGMVIIAVDEDTNQQVNVRMASIEQINRADGDKDFARSMFMALYKDYLGAKA